jgi:hypothetical protein
MICYDLHPSNIVTSRNLKRFYSLCHPRCLENLMKPRQDRRFLRFLALPCTKPHDKHVSQIFSSLYLASDLLFLSLDKNKNTWNFEGEKARNKGNKKGMNRNLWVSNVQLHSRNTSIINCYQD